MIYLHGQDVYDLLLTPDGIQVCWKHFVKRRLNEETGKWEVTFKTDSACYIAFLHEVKLGIRKDISVELKWQADDGKKDGIIVAKLSDATLRKYKPEYAWTIASLYFSFDDYECDSGEERIIAKTIQTTWYSDGKESKIYKTKPTRISYSFT